MLPSVDVGTEILGGDLGLGGSLSSDFGSSACSPEVCSAAIVKAAPGVCKLQCRCRPGCVAVHSSLYLNQFSLANCVLVMRLRSGGFAWAQPGLLTLDAASSQQVRPPHVATVSFLHTITTKA